MSNTSNNETVNIKDKIEFENRDEKNKPIEIDAAPKRKIIRYAEITAPHPGKIYIPAEEEIGANKIIGSVINSMKKYNALTDANLPNTNK